ncbi:aromatic acid exporter family member 2 domain-containing protein [Phanerochaete sordida]|uniref:Aromatic acid exporter family member 2 domain-containing protein n=1 Tax=Phanerochaete sordida TaxID=48140 RepID=A0A9P3LBJ8_9APHY|nr:aromatic acid exporter family member 2 domain-containing protein [Phanerochaete sordida]
MADHPPKVHYDPRMGDEGSDEELPPPTPPRQARKRVVMDRHPTFDESEPRRYPSSQDTEDTFREKEKESEHEKPPRLSVGQWILKRSPINLQWIPANFTWSKLKPVLRSALQGWISVLFFTIPRLERMLGQASFLILVAGFLQPPSGPFIQVLEAELTLLLCVTGGWAWSCLGLFLANLSRNHVDYNAPLAQITTGQYIEAGPAIIQAVFLFFGSAFFLYLKARLGPGPYLIPTILGCICLDVCLSTAALFPYPFYNIGKAVVIPIAFHSALAVFSSAVFFPQTITCQYTSAMGRVFEPLEQFLAKHRTILKMDPSSEEFADAAKELKGLVDKSEGGMAPTAVWLRLLPRDIVWGRFAPSDISALQWSVRRIVTRAEGMNIYFSLIDPTRERFPVTPAPTTPNTPVLTRTNTPAVSRSSSPVRGRRDRSADGARTPETPHSVHYRKHAQTPLHQAIARQLRHLSRTRTHQSHRHHHHHHSGYHDNHLHLSLLELAHTLGSRHDTESAVGVFESQRYITLEATRLSHHQSPEMTARFTELLSQACDELLGASKGGLGAVREWVTGVRRADWGSRHKVERRRQERKLMLEDVRRDLHQAVEAFRKDTRLRVLDPYRSAFDPHHVKEGKNGLHDAPPHKYLFHCYMYEYHVLQFALLVEGLLDEIIKLEEQRPKARLWVPNVLNIFWFFTPAVNTAPDLERDDDEDPDVVQYMEQEPDSDLGATRRRDPDALPPSNKFESAMYWLHRAFAALGHGNAVFAIKAGLLTVILSIPYRLKNSAHFAYDEHFVWGIFMGQLTLSRFRGDTTFGLVARVISTFLGGVLGTVMWYISAGKGHGNIYGLAAVTAVCFPFFFFGRLYWPGAPMFNLIFFVTSVLVIGFSWQDVHFPAGFLYYGINVAWRRFVLVTAGVFAAFLASFLPPSTTLRAYQRRMMATTVAEIGSVYCSVVSFANTQGTYEVDKGAIVQSLIAIRLKLKRSLVLRTNIVYEFSLRGKWPAQRYQKILEIQLQMAYLLSHLMSVCERLEPAWRRAFLRRTRLLDADFQGDVLAVISMISTALRTGQPLPQITPCPLLDRYMENQHGLNVIRGEADEDYGLPRTMTIDTLANEQYLCFSVGCTTAFGIVMRLDRLMMATKELVGEQYHIHGVGVPLRREYTNASSMPRPAKDA